MWPMSEAEGASLSLPVSLVENLTKSDGKPLGKAVAPAPIWSVTP